MQKQNTIIIDGNNLAYRCKHVFSLSNNGVDVSITYGFLKVLSSYLQKFKATSVIVCWDGGIPEFRRFAVPEYKANRHLDDDPIEREDFHRQVNELHRILPMMGIVSIKTPCVEADDLMYHASVLCKGHCIIVSSDKDMFQALSDFGVEVYNPYRETLYDVDKFETEYGISIHDYIDWRALQGDSSDNISGVPGIGEKTATKLFHEFGTLTGIVNAALGINPTGKLSGALSANISNFGFTRIANNVLVMALYFDRTGSRDIIMDACDSHTTADRKISKRYLYDNNFTSLFTTFLVDISKLQAPELSISNKMRIPIVYPCKRKPAK